MIFDTLAQAPRYLPLSPRFQKAFKFIDLIEDNSKSGRHEIDGDDVYALVQRYTTRPAAQGQFEAHRRYIDLQYIHAGRETILWASLPSLIKNVTKPYDESGDAALFGLVPTAVPIPLSEGQFAILFPEDGHVPGCVLEQPCEVVKVLVKVRVG